ncbi:MAG: hypothetical protein WA639_19855 [Candidatus Acidiferrum sp.]
MKNALRIAFTSLAGVMLATAVAAAPPRTFTGTTRTTTSEQTAQLQTVSGKIASVAKTSFTLTVAAEPGANHGQQFQETSSSPKTMNFEIDQNTTIDGKLKVGSSADVSYRLDNGQNVAVNVRVTP